MKQSGTRFAHKLSVDFFDVNKYVGTQYAAATTTIAELINTIFANNFDKHRERPLLGVTINDCLLGRPPNHDDDTVNRRRTFPRILFLSIIIAGRACYREQQYRTTDNISLGEHACYKLAIYLEYLVLKCFFRGGEDSRHKKISRNIRTR